MDESQIFTFPVDEWVANLVPLPREVFLLEENNIFPGLPLVRILLLTLGSFPKSLFLPCHQVR